MLAGVALEVKEGLARQALFPVRRVEAASKPSSASADAKPVSTSQWQPDFHPAPLRLTSRVSPRRRASFFCFAKRKYPKKRRPAAGRIPAPAMPPPRARPELAARYRRAASDSRPLKTLCGRSGAARADGTGATPCLLSQLANCCYYVVLSLLLLWLCLATKSLTMPFPF